MKYFISTTLLSLIVVSGCKGPTASDSELTTQEVIFFSSDRDGKATNIYMMSQRGEMIKQITKHTWGEYAATAISPDRSELLFYQATPGFDIDVAMDIYIYKIKEDSIIGPLTHGHPGNFAPDGKSFVFSRHTFSSDGGFESIYLYDQNNSTERKLTIDGRTSFYPQLSPDGKTILYQSAKFWFRDSLNCWQLHLMDIDGSNIRGLTPLRDGYYAGNGVFSPDGKTIVFNYNEETFRHDICKLDLNDKKLDYITNTRFHGNDSSPNYSSPSIDHSGAKVFFYSKRFNENRILVTELFSVNIDGKQLI